MDTPAPSVTVRIQECRALITNPCEMDLFMCITSGDSYCFKTSKLRCNVSNSPGIKILLAEVFWVPANSIWYLTSNAQSVFECAELSAVWLPRKTSCYKSNHCNFSLSFLGYWPSLHTFVYLEVEMTFLTNQPCKMKRSLSMATEFRRQGDCVVHFSSPPKPHLPYDSFCFFFCFLVQKYFSYWMLIQRITYEKWKGGFEKSRVRVIGLWDGGSSKHWVSEG